MNFKKEGCMIDPLPLWIVEYEKLPQDKTGFDSPGNITNFINDRVNQKVDLNVKFSPPPVFTWQKAIFESLFRIISITPSLDPITPAIKVATAWQTSILASTMIISAGATMSPPPPPTNGIISIATAVIDPATVAAAFSGIIADLSSAKPSPTRLQAELPKAIYKAFTKITYTVTGIDTSPPPTGPFPFALPLTSVS